MNKMLSLNSASFNKSIVIEDDTNINKEKLI